MPDRSTQALPTLSPEQRKIAVDNFERARQALNTGNFDYAIDRLLTCCKLDPANFVFRQTLRRAQKDKYGNNLRGSRMAFLSSPRTKARVKAAKASGDYLRVLEHGEMVLNTNPWDVGIQMDMAEAFDALGLIDLAVFTLDQARQKTPKDSTLNRALARLFEKRGDFQKAIALWQLVKDANPSDVEAAHKAKDLAASETIARGQYRESLSGSKPSPILDKLDAQNAEKADRVRDAGPLLKRIEADPTEPSLYVQLAGVYRRAGQDDRARAVIQQGLGPTGNHFALQLELLEIELLPLRKNLDVVEKKLQKLKEKPAADDGDDDEMVSKDELKKLKAKLVKEINAREVDIFRVRADRNPADLGHRLELGQRLMKADKVDEAIAELQLARREERLKGKAAMFLGVCFRLRNNLRLAQRNFEEALAALPPNDEASRKEVLFQLATGAAESGDLPRAMDLGHELANLDFGFRGIGKLLDEWHEKVQQA